MRVANTREIGLKEMLEEIRDHHINITLIIQEELNEFITQFIEDVVKSTYDGLNKELGQ